MIASNVIPTNKMNNHYSVKRFKPYAYIYTNVAVLVGSTVAMANFMTGTKMLNQIFPVQNTTEEKWIKERIKIYSVAFGKGLLYGFGWPVSLPKMYVDLIDDNLDTHIKPLYSRTEYYLYYKAIDFTDFWVRK